MKRFSFIRVFEHNAQSVNTDRLDISTGMTHFQFSVLKNSEKSAKYRNEGNKHYAKKTPQQLLIALKLYNQSICFAPNGSEDLSIGYANRSAVYFDLKLYDVCIQNIEWSRNTAAFPARLIDKLRNRERHCQRLMTKNQDSGILVPTLSYPPHNTVPFIANCLELRKSWQYGRYVIANQDLTVGQIIAIEQPFSTSVSLQQQYERCENCLMECSRSLLPCQMCTAVMFCGEQCREEAMNRFHRFECSVIDLINNELESFEKLSVRMTLCAVSTFGSVDAFRRFTQMAMYQDNNVFNMDYKEIPPIYQYGPIYSMQRAPETESAKLNLGMVMGRLVIDSREPDLIANFDVVQFLWDVTVHHFMSARLNAHRFYDIADMMAGTTKASDSQGSQDDITIGTYTQEVDDMTIGIFPFTSLLNHACIPNVMVTPSGNNMLVTVVRPIGAGEQVFVCDGYHHGDYPIDVRQAELPFKCDCIACEKDYPTGEKAKRGPEPPRQTIWNEAMTQMTNCDVNRALANKDAVIKFMQDNDIYYPIFDIMILQSYLHHIWDLIYSKEIRLEAKLHKLGGIHALV